MANTYKVLGQSAPGAVLTDLYIVPAATEVIISKLVVCNKAAVQKSFRVKVSPDGAGDADAHNQYYDTAIPPNETLELLAGISMNASDKVRVYGSDANVSFSLYGCEVS